jgi:hypothetical protein
VAGVEGGIAILLLLVIFAIVGGAAFLLFGGGGILARNRTPRDPDREGRRPTHTAPTTPASEHTAFAGREEPPPSREDERGG